MFNYRRDSDFYRPYFKVVRIGQETETISEFPYPAGNSETIPNILFRMFLSLSLSLSLSLHICIYVCMYVCMFV
jgi:hypothetical protein